MTTYQDIRTNLSSGDLAFYTKTSGLGGFLVQVGTNSKYNHVGLIWVISGRVFLLEATLKDGVRMVPLSLEKPDVIVKMDVSWNNTAEELALSHIMDPYSLLDAIKAWAHARSSSKGWICTEYVAAILKECGYNLPEVAQTPEHFIDELRRDGKRFVFLEDI